MEKMKVDISVPGLERLLDKTYDAFQEERDLALERYRRQDEMMTSSDDFVLQGKTAVDYLKVASERSNAIFGIAKLVKEIVYKDDIGTGTGGKGSGGGVEDGKKADILRMIKEMDEEKAQGKIDKKDLNSNSNV